MPAMKRADAEILREYGPFPGVSRVNGVTYDGQQVWLASGDKLVAVDPESGKPLRSIDVASHAGTAFDGRYLFQIAEDRIHKIDPQTGEVLSSIPAPGGGGDSGLAWAEGTLWVGQDRARQIHQIDPATGKVLRTLESNRFVTGVTWVEGELWHGTGRAMRATCVASIHKTERFWKNWRCRPGRGCRDLSPTVANAFSVAADIAARCARSADPAGPALNIFQSFDASRRAPYALRRRGCSAHACAPWY
jgi:hypothetical protein